MIATQKYDWVTLAEAQRRLAIGRPAILRLMATGRISVRLVPGSKPRVRSDEVEALALASTRAATL